MNEGEIGTTEQIDRQAPFGGRVLLVIDGVLLQVVPLPGAGTLTVGRSQKCNVAIDSGSVSRHHANLVQVSLTARPTPAAETGCHDTRGGTLCGAFLRRPETRSKTGQPHLELRRLRSQAQNHALRCPYVVIFDVEILVGIERDVVGPGPCRGRIHHRDCERRPCRARAVYLARVHS